jgi:hypothetical protein
MASQRGFCAFSDLNGWELRADFVKNRAHGSRIREPAGYEVVTFEVAATEVFLASEVVMNADDTVVIVRERVVAFAVGGLGSFNPGAGIGSW